STEATGKCVGHKRQSHRANALRTLPFVPPLCLPIRPRELRHHSQGKIVSVATFVAGLEVVSVGRQDRTVGQVAEGATDLSRRGVADHGQDKPCLQRALDCSLRDKGRTSIDRYSQ